jgi:hypothetical protein
MRKSRPLTTLTERNVIMAMPQPSVPSQSAPPWQQKQLPYALKLLIMFGFGIVLVIALVSGITFFVLVPEMLIKGPGPRDTIGSMVGIGLGLGAVLGVSLFGLIKLFPYVSAPTTFKPSYGAIPADARGQPFDVRYRRGGGRSMSGKGTARFDADGLAITGYLTLSPLLQIGIIVGFTIIPLLLLGIGLGIIPALLIAYYIGRKQIAPAIAYGAMRDLNVQGCKVTFTNPGAQPGKVAFYVAAPDGERLYRELQERFPAMFVGRMG